MLAPYPGHFQLGKIARSDLIELGRGTGMPGIATEIAPVAVLDTGEL